MVDSQFIGGPEDDEDEVDNWKDETIPATYEVCPTCQGDGKSSAYLGSFSRENLDELGDEWQDDYFAGHFDRTCEECKGLRVVLVPDRENADPVSLAKWDKQQSDAYEMEQEHRMEMQAEYGPEYMW